MPEEERDASSFLARRPMLSFLADPILNGQFSSASVSRIIWIAQLYAVFIRIKIHACQHVFLVVFALRGMGQQGHVFPGVSSGTQLLSLSPAACSLPASVSLM